MGGELIGGAQDTLALLENSQLQHKISLATQPALPQDLQDAADAAAQSFKVSECGKQHISKHMLACTGQN